MTDFAWINDHRLILASASPRRKELLAKTGIPFDIEVSQAEEIIPPFISVKDTAEYLSGFKAENILTGHIDENVVITGADTIVILGGRVFGKPADERDAFGMLKALSGKWHEVRTGVTILANTRGPHVARLNRVSFTSSAGVRFLELSDDEIRAYIATGEPMDKAGAYGIQNYGALLVDRIDGDYFTVVGLPIARLCRELKNIL